VKLLSQRGIYLMKLLVLDNFDSFTFMLVDYLRQAGASCDVRRNDEPLAILRVDAYDGLVLSPGPGQPHEAGQLMPLIDRYHRRVPMLGVCLGHQALGAYFGATVGPAQRPMHGKVSTVQVLVPGDPLLTGLPDRFRVTRYHSLTVSRLPATLQPLAQTDEGELMAVRHATWPLWGVQFHPEAVLTEHGLPLLQNWINSIRS
jgi:anthranilate synthase/aminodeoxychorismate synthase-like glutamine amidotransferase